MSNSQVPLDPLESRLDSIRLREQAPKISIWEPPGVAATKAAAPVALPIEAQLIATIEQPLRSGEMHRPGNDRKEREIAALLDTLTPVQSLALCTRLAAGTASDPLVIAFGRLLVERRNRLIAFLERRRRCR
jgi:hypothetical protein